MKRNIVTSSGVIKDPDSPRTGVVGCNDLNSEFIYEDIDAGIDLSYEEYLLELKEEELSEEEIEERTEHYEHDSPTHLIGGWKKVKGKYVVDKTKEFSAIHHDGTICVEFSKHLRRVGYTSPCFVMCDGSGPCGDLTSEGDVLAYDLPPEYYIQPPPPNSILFVKEK